MDDSTFTVQVNCMTYNHSSYIGEAMSGFCMQQTTFPFVCVIVDDASTDGEQDVIQDYLRDHFDLPIRFEETDDYRLLFVNHSTNKNCFFVVLFLKYNHYKIGKSKAPYYDEWSRTEYVAICEGDDYWIDPLKLQKQFGFLESHPSYGLVSTVCLSYVQNEGAFYEAANTEAKDLTFEDLLFGQSIVTCTTLFKSVFLESYLNEIEEEWAMGDYPMWLYISQNSRLYRMVECTAVYRVLDESASHSKDPQKALEFKRSSMACTQFFVDKYGLDEDKKVKLYYSGAYNLLRRGISFTYQPFIEEAINYLKSRSLKVPFLFWVLNSLLKSNLARQLISSIMRIRFYIRKRILNNIKR